MVFSDARCDGLPLKAWIGIGVGILLVFVALIGWYMRRRRGEKMNVMSANQAQPTDYSQQQQQQQPQDGYGNQGVYGPQPYWKSSQPWNAQPWREPIWNQPQYQPGYDGYSSYPPQGYEHTCGIIILKTLIWLQLDNDPRAVQLKRS
jgi:hypothetical protein